MLSRGMAFPRAGEGSLELGSLLRGTPLRGPQPAHGRLFPSTGLPPVLHRSPWSYHIPPVSCFTWAPRVALCLWYKCQPSALWRTRPSARTLYCNGEPSADPLGVRSLSPCVGHGLLPLVPVMSQELIISLLGSLWGWEERCSSPPVPQIKNLTP